MLWFKRGLLCVLPFLCVLVLVSACGFTPAYKTKENTEEDMTMKAKLAAIEVMPIPERMGQELRSSLEDALSPVTFNAAPKYRLYITLKKNASPAAMERNRRITRYNIVITATYTLKSIDTNAIIEKGTMKVVSSYDSLDSRFSTFIAENKTTSNAIHELAEQLTTRLMTTAFRDK